MDPEPITRTAPRATPRVVASQSWLDAAFLHWRVPSASVAPLLPAGVRPDEHDGTSWAGLIAFRLVGARLAGSPPIPYLGSFTELNVRLYGVDDDGRRGVVFRSLEASRLAAVVAARAAFSIPYHWAATRHGERDGAHAYASRRMATGVASSLRVRPDLSHELVDDPTADFLTARWALFTRRLGATVRLPNEHEPWRLHPAVLERLDDGLLAAAGLPGVADRPPDSVLFSPGVAARFGPPERGVNGR